MASYYEKQNDLQNYKKSQPKKQKVTNYIEHDGNRRSTYSRRGKNMVIVVHNI